MSHTTTAPASGPSRTTRLLGGTALVAGPALYAVTRFIWPAGSDGSSLRQAELAAAHPGAWYAAAALEGIGVVISLAGTVVLVMVLSGRGRVLARIALGLAVASMIGGVTTWVFNVALIGMAGKLPAKQAGAAYDAAIGSGWGVRFVVLLLVGTLGGIVLAVAAVLGRLVPWWVLVLILVGVVGQTVADSAAPWTVVFSVLEVAAAVLVARGMVEGPHQDPSREASELSEPRAALAD